MLQWLTRRSRRSGTARQLYGSSVAAARDPMFYRDWQVADTLEGRFEMVTLHVALLLRRLTAESQPGKQLGQAVLEEMFASLDDDMRELGVSDLRVPKRVQGAASAFYGRLRAYDAALQSADGSALRDALARNLPAAGALPVAADALAAYVWSAAASLGQQPLATLSLGQLVFAPPRPKQRSETS